MSVSQFTLKTSEAAFAAENVEHDKTVIVGRQRLKMEKQEQRDF